MTQINCNNNIVMTKNKVVTFYTFAVFKGSILLRTHLYCNLVSILLCGSLAQTQKVKEAGLVKSHVLASGCVDLNKHL